MKTDRLPIIPYPKKLVVNDQNGTLKVRGFKKYSDDLLDCVRSFIYMAKKVHGASLSAEGGEIYIDISDSLSQDEYTISITEDGAKILAGGRDGMSYALATLIQMAEADGEELLLPLVEIEDKPDCEYRTLMVDLARKWHPFETLLKYADLCYLYKIKFLHLHFTDSPIYSLPSEKFPKIPTPDKHYTREEIAELNAYAKERNIEIIPEFDVPGHAKPIVAAYPELFANLPTGVEDEEEFALFFADIKQNVICVSKEGVMDSLRDLAKEIADMFPSSRYLHIGGDEANIGEWKNCKTCQEYMEKNGIDGPRALYTHFIKQMTDMVIEIGKTPIVWEGFPRTGSNEISRKVIVTAWESYYYLAPEMIEDGFTITNASWEPMYTVPAGAKQFLPSGRWYPDDIHDWNIYTWKNWNPKTAAYEKPIVVEPTTQVYGATFCAWENDYEGEIQPVRENLAAMSEKVWNINSAMTREEMRVAVDRLVSMAKKIT